VAKWNRGLLGVVGLIVLAVLIVSWFMRAPYAALQSIKVAAERRDIQELNRLIDFPSLKASLKILVMDTVNADVATSNSVPASLARIAVGAMVGPIVEAMITPESVAAMFSGKLPRRDASRPESPKMASGEQEVLITREWEDLSAVRFYIRPASSQEGLTFLVCRDGFSWRLCAIER
jgi:hypothetical protein